MSVRISGTAMTGELVCVVTDQGFEPRAVIVPAGRQPGDEVAVEVTDVEVIPGSFLHEVDDLVLREARERWENDLRRGGAT